MSTPSPVMDHPRNRLPTLFEVLNRQTLAPVDLYSFYIYMRDQQRSVDYLEFWLDVAQHMSSCRYYVRELRRSVLVETPEHEKGPNGSRRDSMLFDRGGDVTDLPGPSMYRTNEEKAEDLRVSAFLRRENSNNNHNNGGGNGHNGPSPGPGPARHSRTASHGSEKYRDGSSSADRHRRPSLMTPDRRADSDSPSHTEVTRDDLRRSALHILYTFLLQGSEREIILPDSMTMRITNMIEVQGRDDPEVFDAAKDYVFQAMERDAFPGFLRSKALQNLVPPSIMLRVIVGLLAFLGGIWTAFSMIFLNYSHISRLWLILPLVIATYMLVSYQYGVDPILALLGLSESTFMSFIRVKEPFVRRLLNKRAMMVLSITTLVVAAAICLFVLVPGKRL